LPFQMSFLGYTNPSVSSTNQLYNIVAIPSGVYRYCKEGRMVWPLTRIVVVGTLPGVLIGAFIRVTSLRDPRNFKLFAAAVILYIGVKMIRDLLKQKTGGAKSSERLVPIVAANQATPPGPLNATFGNPAATVSNIHCGLWRLCYTFQGEAFNVSCAGIFARCFIVGSVGGVYGTGCGPSIAPLLGHCSGRPVYPVAGAALLGTFVTSVAGVAFYTGIAPLYPQVSVAPDWLLGILFGLGGMVGMYLGARCQKFVPAKVIKWMLVCIMLFTALKYIVDYFK